MRDSERERGHSRKRRMTGDRTRDTKSGDTARQEKHKYRLTHSKMRKGETQAQAGTGTHVRLAAP